MLFFFVKNVKKKEKKGKMKKEEAMHTKERGNLLLIAKESNTRHQERHPSHEKKNGYKKTYKNKISLAARIC